MLATANYFCHLLADVYLFTPKMCQADMIDSVRQRHFDVALRCVLYFNS